VNFDLKKNKTYLIEASDDSRNGSEWLREALHRRIKEKKTEEEERRLTKKVMREINILYMKLM